MFSYFIRTYLVLSSILQKKTSSINTPPFPPTDSAAWLKVSRWICRRTLCTGFCFPVARREEDPHSSVLTSIAHLLLSGSVQLLCLWSQRDTSRQDTPCILVYIYLFIIKVNYIISVGVGVYAPPLPRLSLCPVHPTQNTLRQTFCCQLSTNLLKRFSNIGKFYGWRERVHFFYPSDHSVLNCKKGLIPHLAWFPLENKY